MVFDLFFKSKLLSNKSIIMLYLLTFEIVYICLSDN